MGLSGRLPFLKDDEAEQEVVRHMHIPIPLYKPIQEVIKSAYPRLILFSCPKEYFVDVKSQHGDGNIHPSVYSYPIRGAAFMNPKNEETSSLLTLPESPAMKETLKALKRVYSYYEIQASEVVWGPDPVEPGGIFGVFDVAVANQPEVIEHITSAIPKRRTTYALISHAYTPETEQVRLAFEQSGIHAIPVFGPKDCGRKNAVLATLLIRSLESTDEQSSQHTRWRSASQRNVARSTINWASAAMTSRPFSQGSSFQQTKGELHRQDRYSLAA